MTLEPNNPGAVDLLDLAGVGELYRQVYHETPGAPLEKHETAWRRAVNEARNPEQPRSSVNG
jgi:hypothetical protein